VAGVTAGDAFADAFDEAFGEAFDRAGADSEPGLLPAPQPDQDNDGNRQLRSPEAAAAQARADAAAEIRPVAVVGELPEPQAMWARWALLSAAFVAVRSDLGPRVRPAHGWFESARGGSTFWLLPGDRAVLSGGTRDAPALAAAYRGDTPFPKLFAGAPAWVADPVIDSRAAEGLLSFCYWWDGGRWCRGESPGAAEFARSIPGVWTADTVADIIGQVAGLGDAPTAKDAVAGLVAAAGSGVVDRDMLVEVFGDDGNNDGAFHQLEMAGVVRRTGPPIARDVAVGIVARYMLDNGLESPGYRIRDLTASRLSVGWMVYAPVPDGELRIGRTIFYVADDGVLERATSAEAPSRREAGFERRYHERRMA
jgi:hypothetical protein